MKGSEVVEALEKKLKVKGNKALAEALGRSSTSIQQWRDAPVLSANQIANILADGKAAAKVEAHREGITKIVEFFPITRCRSKQEAMWELFSTEGSEYRAGLKKALDGSQGIYLFYDSRGRALYAGKATKSLWKEMKAAFNRDRNEQKIYRVDHPEAKDFDVAREQTRLITGRLVSLAELSVYFSAYQVPVTLIPELEALLIHGFPNDLLNIRMEKFTTQKHRVKSTA
ncbi:hypothetical protein L6R53_03585 [Myxococcota bacterium]|nr:hypothetical protein [Myxococcota bacterium]